MRPISDDDAADYREQDAEDRERNRLFRMGERRGPDAPDSCEPCHGTGMVNSIDPWSKECPRCLGTGVQP